MYFDYILFQELLPAQAFEDNDDEDNNEAEILENSNWVSRDSAIPDDEVDLSDLYPPEETPLTQKETKKSRKVSFRDFKKSRYTQLLVCITMI